MNRNTPMAIGNVVSLAINGQSMDQISFAHDGPIGDTHSGYTRHLSGHDGAYIRTSALKKGAPVFNWRTWTGLSVEEVSEIEKQIDCDIPIGCLLENIIFEGITNFSKLLPGTRLVFRPRENESGTQQVILAVWEENGPCKTVGERLEEHHGISGLKTKFIREAQNKRGVMGFVLSPGEVSKDDSVLVYPPVR